MALMFAFFESVFRKGPGSDQSTLQALAMLQHLPPRPRVVDFGCGSGVATLALARSMDCTVAAVESHQPFLEELQALAEREGLAERILTVQADMADPPFADESFDVVWSEAAIYNIGFEKGLQRWRRLLPTGGCAVVSEVSWIQPNPPRAAAEFWQAEYPAMTTIDDNLAMVANAGFESIGHFVLPRRDWENYYGPLEERIVAFRAEHPTDADAQSLADSLQQEIDIWRDFGGSFGYVFYLGKAC